MDFPDPEFPINTTQSFAFLFWKPFKFSKINSSSILLFENSYEYDPYY